MDLIRWEVAARNLPEYIQGMLEYKESLGYSRKTYESYLKDFQRYFMGAGHNVFIEGTVLPWCEKRESETPKGFRRRVTPLRELSKYLYAMGYAEYIVPTDIFPTMHREAIEKTTSDINPLYSNEYDIEWEDDEELLKRLYCLK